MGRTKEGDGSGENPGDSKACGGAYGRFPMTGI